MIHVVIVEWAVQQLTLENNLTTFSGKNPVFRNLKKLKVLPRIRKLVPCEYSLCAGERVAWVVKGIETEMAVGIRE